MTMQTRVIQWDFDAWEDYLYWQGQDKRMLKRINQLVITHAEIRLKG